jgi:acyl carrier protein
MCRAASEKASGGDEANMIEAQIDNTATSSSSNATPAKRELLVAVRDFVTTNFYVPDAAALRDDASLLDTGVIDSTGVLEVIAFVEREFGIQVADDEIVPENLDSIERLASYVHRKRG